MTEREGDDDADEHRRLTCGHGLDVEVVPFHKRLDRSTFDSGMPELDSWFRTQAGQQERRNNTRTFVAVERGTSTAIGYYASTTYRLDLDEAARAFGAGKRAYPVPAVLLARLAVTKAYQRFGVGTGLLLDALGQMAAASMAIGFEVVVVDAIDASAATFYRRAGFTPFEDHPLELFLTVKDLRATFSR